MPGQCEQAGYSPATQPVALYPLPVRAPFRVSRSRDRSPPRLRATGPSKGCVSVSVVYPESQKAATPASATVVGVSQAIGAVFVVTGGVGVVYGLFDIFVPSLTTRWQVRSTAKHGGSRRAVGTGFQRALGIDPEGDPWNDAGVKRKVRWIGLGLSLFSLVVVILGAWLLASP
jgi:hypothetical protein